MLMIIAIVGRFARAMRASLGDPVFRVLLVALGLDLFAGTLAYMWLEGWGWIDALYFCVTTQATVGFGDLVPQTDGGKLFTIVYIFAGLGLIVTFAQRLGRHLYRNVYDAEVASEGGPPAENDRPL
jgi:voltage-gated potassium channel